MALSTRQLEQKMLTGTDCSPDQNLYSGGYWSMWKHKNGSIRLIMSLHDELSDDKIQVFENWYTDKQDLKSNCESYRTDFLENEDRDKTLSYTDSNIGMIYSLNFDDLNDCLNMCSLYSDLGSGYLFDPYSDLTTYTGSYRQVMLQITGY